jgi:hypothetical protein
MSGRPDDGYRAAGRIERRSSARSRVVVATLGVVAFAWLAATLGSQAPETALSTNLPTSPGASMPAATNRIPQTTLPPVVEAFDGAPTAPFPILLNGLASLDARTATLSRSVSEDWTQWPFLLADGSTICVCLIPAGSDPPSRMWVVRAGGDATLISEAPVPDWPGSAATEDLLVDVALDPDAGSALVAAAIRHGEAWTVRLDRVAIDGKLLAGTVLGEVPEKIFSPGGPRGIGLWLAPDRNRARVELSDRLGPAVDERLAPTLREWIVETPQAELGPVRTIEDSDGVPVSRSCLVEGWGRPDAFIRVCLEPGTDQQPAIVVHRFALDGTSRQVNVGRARELEGQAWLIDAVAGLVYGWSAREQELYRVDADSLFVLARDVPPPDGSLAPTEAPWPAPRTSRAAWSIGRLGHSADTGPLIGSPDGAVLYTAGIDPESEPLQTLSNGIYAFDAETLKIVGHWIPVATYASLGITADARFVLAFGQPSPVELAAQGNHGPSIGIHDARSGGIVAILRRVEGQLGGHPSFLVAEPGP